VSIFLSHEKVSHTDRIRIIYALYKSLYRHHIFGVILTVVTVYDAVYEPYNTVYHDAVYGKVYAACKTSYRKFAAYIRKVIRNVYEVFLSGPNLT